MRKEKDGWKKRNERGVDKSGVKRRIRKDRRYETKQNGEEMKGKGWSEEELSEEKYREEKEGEIGEVRSSRIMKELKRMEFIREE